jgi:L-alanine-DL-glutamate epimerase-like enolase superfamily enzyme
MKIIDVSATPVSMKLKEPRWWGTMASPSIGCIVVEVKTDQGIIGIGEAGFSSMYWPSVGPIIIETLKPLLIGEDPLLIEHLFTKMHRATHGWGRRGFQTYAVSGVEIALWDIMGKVAGLPIWRLLGGFQRSIPAYWAPCLKPAKAIAKECEGAVRAGFKAIKLRVGLGPEEDLKIVSSVRKVVGEEIVLTVDANMAYDYRTAVAMAEEFLELKVKWLEEPIGTHSLTQYIEEHARLNESTDMPLAGGESLFTRWEFVEVLSRRAFDVVQPDAVSVGGIAETKKIAAMASAYNIPCVPHIACSSVAGIGFIANLHVIGSLDNALYVEYDAYESPIRDELFQEPVKAEKGMVKMPERPGLGLELNSKALAKYSMR